jgi:hypothetical protein
MDVEQRFSGSALRRLEYMRWVRRERYGGFAGEFGEEFASGLYSVGWGTLYLDGYICMHGGEVGRYAGSVHPTPLGNRISLHKYRLHTYIYIYIHMQGRISLSLCTFTVSKSGHDSMYTTRREEIRRPQR